MPSNVRKSVVLRAIDDVIKMNPTWGIGHLVELAAAHKLNPPERELFLELLQTAGKINGADRTNFLDQWIERERLRKQESARALSRKVSVFSPDIPEGKTVNIGKHVHVLWSNGAGFSVYRVEDVDEGPHRFVLHAEYEYVGDGSGNVREMRP